MTPPDLAMVVTEPVTLGLGGFRIRLVPHAGAGLGLYRPYEAFVVDEHGAADCEVECGWGRVVAEGEVTSARREWELRRTSGGGEQIVFSMPTDSGRLDFLSLSISPDACTARVVRDPAVPGGESLPVGFPWDEHLVSRLGARADRVIIHGSSVLAAGRAWVFVGHSGAGKSTMAKLAEEAGGVVLSDDRTVLGVVDDKVMAWGTPWHGTHRRGRPDAAEVGGIFLLNQAECDEIEPLATAAAFGELYVRSVLPLSRAEEVEQASVTLEAILSRTMAARLHFRPSVDAFRLVTRLQAVAPPGIIHPN